MEVGGTSGKISVGGDSITGADIFGAFFDFLGGGHLGHKRPRKEELWENPLSASPPRLGSSQSLRRQGWKWIETRVMDIITEASLGKKPQFQLGRRLHFVHLLGIKEVVGRRRDMKITEGSIMNDIVHSTEQCHVGKNPDSKASYLEDNEH
ncbi:hypothetical protein LIER_23209 [Lithospermum erythrorhizon]|uniref:Uncharacterized protein n=1 Tax=Lithospermum erythrorhizon TaxID=34254 RepID=A0AAV3QWT8_LITER